MYNSLIKERKKFMNDKIQEMADRLRKNQERNHHDYEQLERQHSNRIKKLEKTHEETYVALKEIRKKHLLAKSELPNLSCARILFSDYDFIRLFLATIRMNGTFSVERDLLRYQLYEYYNLKEYHDLFQDFAIKQQIEGNFIDMEEALQNAVLYGLITPHDIHPTNSKRLILISEEEAQGIIRCYDEKTTEKMYSLVKSYSQNNVISKKKILKID